jgi:hypothetical protein
VGVDRHNPVAMDTYRLDVFIHHVVLPHPEPRTRFGILFRLWQFPPLLIRPDTGLNPSSTTDTIVFSRGKSCLFQMEAAKLQSLLPLTPVLSLVRMDDDTAGGDGATRPVGKLASSIGVAAPPGSQAALLGVTQPFLDSDGAAVARAVFDLRLHHVVASPNPSGTVAPTPCRSVEIPRLVAHPEGQPTSREQVHNPRLSEATGNQEQAPCPSTSFETYANTSPHQIPSPTRKPRRPSHPSGASPSFHPRPTSPILSQTALGQSVSVDSAVGSDSDSWSIATSSPDDELHPHPHIHCGTEGRPTPTSATSPLDPQFGTGRPKSRRSSGTPPSGITCGSEAEPWIPRWQPSLPCAPKTPSCATKIPPPRFEAPRGIPRGSVFRGPLASTVAEHLQDEVLAQLVPTVDLVQTLVTTLPKLTVDTLPQEVRRLLDHHSALTQKLVFETNKLWYFLSSLTELPAANVTVPLIPTTHPSVVLPPGPLPPPAAAPAVVSVVPAPNAPAVGSKPLAENTPADHGAPIPPPRPHPIARVPGSPAPRPRSPPFPPPPLIIADRSSWSLDEMSPATDKSASQSSPPAHSLSVASPLSGTPPKVPLLQFAAGGTNRGVSPRPLPRQGSATFAPAPVPNPAWSTVSPVSKGSKLAQQQWFGSARPTSRTGSPRNPVGASPHWPPGRSTENLSGMSPSEKWFGVAMESGDIDPITRWPSEGSKIGPPLSARTPRGGGPPPPSTQPSSRHPSASRAPARLSRSPSVYAKPSVKLPSATLPVTKPSAAVPSVSSQNGTAQSSCDVSDTIGEVEATANPTFLQFQQTLTALMDQMS